MLKIRNYLENFQKVHGKYIFLFFSFGLLFHLLAVIFSEGFHRPDEHLGIMRFVGYKLGLLTSSQALTSWEWPAQIRPWFQPYLYYLITIIPVKLGLTNPFVLTFLLRLFSSLMAYFAHLYFFEKTVHYCQTIRGKHVFAFGLTLLWFLPFFHARTTAENLGTSFFLFGLTLFISKINSLEDKSIFSGSTKDILLIGSLWSLSFITRYQMIAMTGPILIWIFLKVENKGKLLSLGVLSFVVMQLLNFPLDFLGYGEWTLAPWNYFKENIVSGKSSHFGTDPFWYYLPKTLSRGIPFISLFLVIPTFWIFIKKPLHLLSFIGFFFLAIHSVIGHKEIRFIFPMVPLVAFYAAIFVESISEKCFPKWLWKFLFFQSVVALLISSMKPAHNPIKFYKHLYYHPSKMTQIYTLNVIRDQLFFYQNRPITFQPLKKIEDVETIKSESSWNKTFWILTDKLPQRKYLEDVKKCTVDYSSYLEWVLNNFGKYLKRSKVWTLLVCPN